MIPVDGVTGPAAKSASRSLATALCDGALARGWRTWRQGWSSLNLMVSNDSGPAWCRLRASSRDDHELLCRNRRVFEELEHRGCERQWRDCPGDESPDRSDPADRMVAWLWLAAGADRPGSWALVAMALRGDEGSRLCGRAVGDAACAQCIPDDGGEERSQGCARDRRAGAGRLVPSGSLQVAGRAGDAGDAFGAPAGRSEAGGRGDDPARPAAQFWAQGRKDHADAVCRSDQGAGERQRDAADHRGVAAGGT